MFMQVDLPLPEAPMMATNSPSSTEKLTPLSASNCWSPMRKTRRISLRSMTQAISERAPHGGTAGTGFLLGFPADLLDDDLVPLLQRPLGQFDPAIVADAGLDRHGHRFVLLQDVHLGP